MTNAERIGIPVLLAGATYGLFAVVVTAWEKLNDRRDIVFGSMNDKFTTVHREHILYSNWLPMYLGLCGYLAVFAVIVFLIPRFAKFEEPKLERLTRVICRFVSLLIATGFFAFVGTGVWDFLQAQQMLRDNPSPVKTIIHKSPTADDARRSQEQKHRLTK
jgi:hypothetical protein